MQEPVAQVARIDDDKVAAIDRAVNAARARAAAKATGGTAGDGAAEGTKEGVTASTEKLTPEQKAEARKARQAERDAAKQERAAAKAARAAQPRGQAHMAKVARAADKLTALDAAATILFNEATGNLTAAQVLALAGHLVHFTRTQSTERALRTAIAVDARVRIVSGSQHVGKEGTVTKSARIRCYVKVDGVAKPVYLFTSDVEPVAPAQAQGSTEEGAPLAAAG